MQTLGYLLVGLAAGIFSGLFGIGGGLIIVPALVLAFGFEQIRANATSLAALIPPVGLLGAAVYYKQGLIDWRAALLIAVGLFLGAYGGAQIAIGLSPATLKRAYGIFLLVIGARMLIFAK
jgi:uncharacterized membrane protein YfcA